VIAVRGLVHRHRGAPAPTLRGVSFALGPGQLAAVLGPSGAGKSTLLRCLAGLEPYEAGEVELDGVVARGGARAAGASLRGRAGLVPQAFDLFPHLSALDNCTLAPRLVRREARAAAEARAQALLDRLGVGERSGAWPAQLSGGQRQRVAIARALAMRPAVLLYDEPTSSLDPSLRGEVRRTLFTVREQGVTQLVVTHDEELAGAADLVLVLAEGRLAPAGGSGATPL
jgi:ABC-type polar amino acid transport system ATPase subunit